MCATQIAAYGAVSDGLESDEKLAERHLRYLDRAGKGGARMMMIVRRGDGRDVGTIGAGNPIPCQSRRLDLQTDLGRPAC